MPTTEPGIVPIDPQRFGRFQLQQPELRQPKYAQRQRHDDQQQLQDVPERFHARQFEFQPQEWGEHLDDFHGFDAAQAGAVVGDGEVFLADFGENGWIDAQAYAVAEGAV